MSKSIFVHPDDLEGWQTARKTAPVWAQASAAAVSSALLPHLSLQTLEGIQALRSDAMICKGTHGNVWQQSVAELLNEYEATGSVDIHNWQVYLPKTGPITQIEVVQVPYSKGYDGFALLGCHGKKGAHKDATDVNRFAQLGKFGDWVARRKTDPTDWHVITDDALKEDYEFLN